MIESMDDAVGTLIDTLDRLGIAENTIIVFASDNGGNMYNWVDNTVPTSNAPLRGGKATMYEGGVRGPCSIVWPNHFEKGVTSKEIIQSCDFYPTILDMLELKPKPSQKFDGISLVPALDQKKLQRDAIFTYFPHSPRVPDWLPPAISVHQGDWKLIRLFQNGEDGAHRWKLYNLADDIGETKDVSQAYPDRVAKLDALIETFLKETNAAVPLANPNFVPGKYNIQNEGKAEPHGKNPKSAARKPGKLVAGWQPGGTAKLSLKENRLVVTSDGGDPRLSFDFAKPVPEGDVTLKLKLKSDSDGIGQVFWAHRLSRPKFAATRQVKFEFSHDGEVQDVSVVIPSKNPLTSIRLDPSRAKGRIEILSAELFSAKAKSLHRWNFGSN